MEDRFPILRFADFTDVKPRDPPRRDADQEVSRSVLSGQSSSRLAISKLQLVEVWLRTPGGQVSRKCKYTTDRNHGDIQPAGPRFRFYCAGPGDPAVDPNDQVTICWRMKHTSNLQSGLLQLFVTGSAQPVWEKTLSKAELKARPPGATAADVVGGTVFGGLAWDGGINALAPHVADFTDNVVLAAKSPYKLKLTIFAKSNKVLAKRQCWTYFDVPYWHKYKLLAYVPTTNMGRFSMEFDPREAMFKVLAGIYFVAYNIPTRWNTPAATLAGQMVQNCQQSWSDQFAMQRAGAINKVWRIAFQVTNRGLTTSSRDDEVAEDFDPPLVRRAAATRAGVFVSLRPGLGMSYLKLRPVSRYANLKLTESAFAAVHDANLARSVVTDELGVLLAELAPLTGGAPVQLTSQDPPTITVTFGPGLAVLNGATPILQAVADCVAKRAPELVLPVRVTAVGNTTVLNTQRAQAIVAAIQPRLGANLVVTAPEIAGGAENVVVNIAYHDDGSKDALLRAVVQYCAAVHEYGHGLGLPDEYFSYNTGGFLGSFPSQVQMRAMCATDNQPSWVQPEKRTTDMMSCGTRMLPRYYLTLLEGIRAMIGAWTDAPDPNWTVVNTALAGAAAGAVNESPDFAPLVRCVEAAEALANRSILAVNRLTAEMDAQATTEAIQTRVMYRKILRRDNLQPVAGPNLATGDHSLLAMAVRRSNTLLHCSTYINPREVTPIIEIPEHFTVNNALTEYTLLDRDDDSARQPVLLRSSNPYEGTGRFTCGDTRLVFYREPRGGNPLYQAMVTLPAPTFTSAELEQGVTLYLEQDQLVNQADLELTLQSVTSAVSALPAQVRVKWSSEAYLQVFPVSVLESDDPPALSQAEMTQPGVFIPVTPGWRPGLAARACVVIVKPVPNNVSLYLRVNPKLSIYAAQTGGRPVSSRKNRNGTDWNELEVSSSKFRRGTQVTYWVQGDQASDAKCDEKIFLQLKAGPLRVGGTGSTLPGTECSATVVSLSSQVAKIPCTPALTARNIPNAGANAPPAFQDFQVEVESARQPGTDHSYYDLNFANNPPLVVLTGSAPDGVVMESILEPSGQLAFGIPATWVMERAADDAAALRTAYNEPAPLNIRDLSPGVGPQTYKVTIPNDAVGSFHIRTMVGRSTIAVTNYVGVKAEAVGPEAPNVAVVPQFRADAAARLQGLGSVLAARTGAVPFPDPTALTIPQLQAQACAAHAGRVRLTGGGPDGRRGLRLVKAGWIQNKLASRLEAEYTDSTGLLPAVYTARGMMLSNASAGQVIAVPDPYNAGASAADHFFVGNMLPTAPIAVVPAVGNANPVLDTGRNDGGGLLATLGRRLVKRAELPGGVDLGDDLVVLAVDNPGTEFLPRHRTRDNALLTQAFYEHTFRAYLCVWVDHSGADVGNGPGDRLYGAVAEFEWQLEATWTVGWPGAVAAGMSALYRGGNPNWTQNAAVAETRVFRAWISVPYNRYPQCRPASGLLEVRPPTPLQLFGWDFQQ